jgi:hypothetical protein
MQGVRRKKEWHALPLILTDEIKSKPLLCKSFEDAITLALGFKKAYPEITYEIYEYYGTIDSFDISQFGKWNIGKRPLAII